MASIGSRGCLQCRKRRVKCDQALPSCLRCVKRDEACVGYRDDSALLFRSENEKVALRVHRRASMICNINSSSSSTSAPPGNMVLPYPATVPSRIVPLPSPPAFRVKVAQATPGPAADLPGPVDRFFDKYIMYPCNNSSMPGFLEHLPSLFDESQVEGRFALRWAVWAAAYASLSKEAGSVDLSDHALQCYGLALSALGDALADAGQAPDDYTLMAVVVLDIFESLFLPDNVSKGCHSGGMVQILRLQGPDYIHGARGWSLFRLSHHRLQKQQLAFKKAPLPESDLWLASLDGDTPFVQIEKSNLEISKTCERARRLRKKLLDANTSIDNTIEMIQEMHALDFVSTTWRAGPEWFYKTIPCPVDVQDHISYQAPLTIQLHTDVWIAYEWNYHRTARIILHEHLLECLERFDTVSVPEHTSSDVIDSLRQFSISVLRSLIDNVLSTVPQSLGRVDHNGQTLRNSSEYASCRGIGGYFLLWPIKVIKSTPSATPEQRSAAKAIFEYIREYTGMKTTLGEASCI